MKGTGFGTRRFPEGAKQKISGREELPFVWGGRRTGRRPAGEEVRAALLFRPVRVFIVNTRTSSRG
ncbi:MAG: hypothetical protein C6W56_13225 [Caldibacillus debilis]|nr:MAG: hypothetical protein C6W56_13225 [Caldibacillus debilis]